MQNCSGKHLEHTKEEIEEFLNKFKKLVRQGKFVISFHKLNKFIKKLFI